ncbi:peptidylprolyl isomerase [Nitratifractor sp.]
MRRVLLAILLVAGLAMAGEKGPVVLLKTNQGEIALRLFPKAAPLAVKNFIGLVKKGYYNGVTFHRVIKGFMIQGGDPTGTGRGGESIWGREFKNEYAPNLVFDRPYLLAMANRGPNTNGSQFFITVAPAPWLNGGYTIFGEVIRGQKVVNKIDRVPTGPGDKPLQKQVILKATLEK